MRNHHVTLSLFLSLSHFFSMHRIVESSASFQPLKFRARVPRGFRRQTGHRSRSYRGYRGFDDVEKMERKRE